MTKKILATLMCICVFLAFTACGASNASSDEQAEKAVATPLTYVRNIGDEDMYDSNLVETKEGVVILCSSNYVLGPESGGQFIFMLSDWAEEECLEDEDSFDWNVKFVSNGHIYQTDFYDYEGNLIATEECNGMATVDQDYKDTDTYIDTVILHIEYEDELFTAMFIRSGA
ncbi:MAG: hypothetical protein IJN50_06635 [Clostridia bacterium]|nr:hypothetical protein [Clostridia bacterium]